MNACGGINDQNGDVQCNLVIMEAGALNVEAVNAIKPSLASRLLHIRHRTKGDFDIRQTTATFQVTTLRTKRSYKYIISIEQ